MRTVAAGQRGFTLVELLISMTLMLIVLGATLTSFDVFGRTQSQNQRLNDSQEIARSTIDRLSLQLRNLANPSTATVSTIDIASPYRLIFQTNDPAKRWVGYCLATSGSGNGQVPAAAARTATSESELLYFQTSTAASVTTAMEGGSPATACPAAGWTKTVVQAERIVNRRLQNPFQAPGPGNAQLDRPVFTYNACASGAASCLPQITDIATTLWVDPDTRRLPAEVSIQTGVYLRNQNQAPTSAYSATQSASFRTWLFNSTIASDPEGRTLGIQWYKGPAGATLAQLPDCISAQTSTVNGNTWTCIGTDPLLNYTFPAADGSSQTVYLAVKDPGGLQDLCSKSITLSTRATGPVSCP